MADVKWIKLDPDAALAGMAELTLEERGVYWTIVNLYYSRGGNLPDDERVILRHLYCRPQTWRRLKAQLINYGKLTVNLGQIEPRRAAQALLNARKLMVKGQVLAGKRWNINGDGDATRICEPKPKPQPQSKKKKVSIPKTICPDTWEPTSLHYELGKKRGLSTDGVNDQAYRMRNWSTGGPNLRANWDSVFSNWLTNNYNTPTNGNGNGNGHGKPRPLQDDSLSASRAAGRLAEAAERGEFQFGPRPSLLPQEGRNDLLMLPKGRGAKP